MLTRVSIAAAAALMATVATSYAQTTINGSYTAYSAETSGKPGYAPTINADGGPYQSSPFTENLTVGTTTAVGPFLQVAPISGGSSVGTVQGTVAVNFTFTAPGGSTVTGVSYSNPSNAGDPANAATLSNGVVSLSANYQLFYGSQTDCLTWDVQACTVTGNTTTITDTLVLTFSDQAVLNVNLYDWSDWNMAPNISYKLVKAPTAVPEPASFAIFGTAIAGLLMMRRRSLRAKTSGAMSS